MVVLAQFAPERDGSMGSARALLDFLTNGGDLRALFAEGVAELLLIDLSRATVDLAAELRARAVVRVRIDRAAWEIGLARDGRDVLVSLFQGGPCPDVVLFERRVDGNLLTERVLGAIRTVPGADARSPSRARANDVDEAPMTVSGMPAARLMLERAPRFEAGTGLLDSTVVSIEPTGETSVVLGADATLHTSVSTAAPSAVLRADLMSLLFRGRMRVTIGENTRELPELFVFLVAEQLVAMSLDAIEAAGNTRPYHRRVVVAGDTLCGIRIDPRGGASLTLGPRRRGDDRAEPATFPAVDVGALAQGVLAFGRALARSLIRRDRSQGYNLRLVEFREHLRELSQRVREVTRDESKINPEPESYRAFAVASRVARPAPESMNGARLRYSPKWLATIPSIDLRSTFLCGNALLVGATGDAYCLDRRTGEIAWRRPMPRGISVMTPAGLARLEPDGLLSIHDLDTGDVTWTAKLAPRVGASASGAVVSAPGIPRMLLISEGAKRLAAIDLDSGEIRWRHATRRGANFRIRRAGKLALVVSGDTALTALDVLSGEVVWRYCDPLRFTSHVAVDNENLFAVAGGGAVVGRGGARLHSIDPWSGIARKSLPLPASVSPVGAPMLTSEAVVIATHGRSGTGLCSFDRKTLELRFQRDVCASTASCMVVDDTIVVNSESGELVSVDASEGTTRYRHVFSSAEGDKPRRLEPVLRSGALFVPQSEVHVVRPRDGVLLGKVPSDLIPDLLRVDERCDVYMVEESGHLAAFASSPRLTLVQ
jgi:hypothetical protein